MIINKPESERLKKKEDTIWYSFLRYALYLYLVSLNVSYCYLNANSQHIILARFYLRAVLFLGNIKLLTWEKINTGFNENRIGMVFKGFFKRYLFC